MELAAEVSLQSGKVFVYTDLSEEKYKSALVSIGLPEGLASMLADSDAAAAKGALFDDSHELSRLIGRKTTPFSESVAVALSE